MGSNAIGEIPVLITGDYSQLEKDLKAAEQIASKSAKDLSEAFNTAAVSGLEKFGEGIAQWIEHPLQSAQQAVGSFVTAMGPIGLVAAAAVGSIAALGHEILSLVLSQGEAAEATNNLANRLNLTFQQTKTLSEMAEVAGVNIGVLNRVSMRLADAYEHSATSGKKVSDALKAIGVDANGTGDTLLRMLEKLAEIPDANERIAASYKIMGRGAVELEPLLRELFTLRAAIDELGGSLDENGVKKLLKADDAANLLAISWRHLKESLAATFAPAVTAGLEALSNIIHLKVPKTSIEEQIENITERIKEMEEEAKRGKRGLADFLAASTGMVDRVPETGDINAQKNQRSYLELLKAQADQAKQTQHDLDEAARKQKEFLDGAEERAKKAAEAIAKAFSLLEMRDVTKGVKDLQDAFKALASSGKLNAEQLVVAQGKVNEKIYELTHAAEKAALEYETLRSAAEKVESKLNAIQRIDFVKSLFPKSWLEEQKEMLGLIEKINEAMTELSQSGLEKSAFSSVGEGLDSFAKMFPVIEKLNVALDSLGGESMVELSKAVKDASKNYDVLAASIDNVIVGQRDLDLAMEKELEARIRLKAVTGQDATKEIVQLDDLRRVTEELAKASQRWGLMILDVREAFDQLLDARKILDTIGKALFDTSDNDRLRDSIQDLTADLEDQAQAWEQAQRDASDSISKIERDLERALADELADYNDFVSDLGGKFNEIVAKHAESMQQIQQDANRNLRDLSKDYSRFVEDTNERIAEARADGDAKEVAQLQKQLRRRAEDYSQHIADLNLQTSERLQAEQKSQQKETESLQKQLDQRTQAHVEAQEKIRAKAAEEIADVEENLAKQKLAYDAFVVATTAKIAELEDNMTNAFERIGNAFAEMVLGFVSEVGKMVASTLLQGYLDDLKKKFLEAFHIPIPDVKGAIAKAGAPPVNVPESSVPGAGGVPSGGGSGGSGFGANMGTLGAVSGAVSAVSDVIANFQFYAMNKSLDIIVKHTLETVNELRNFRRDSWEQQANLFYKLDDMWNEIRNVVEIMRLIGQTGLGGEGDGSLSQQIADVINSRPASVDGSTEALLENAEAALKSAEQLERVEVAASRVTYGQQAVTSSLDNLNTAVESSYESFNGFSTAMQGSVPPMLEASEALGKVVDQVEKFSSGRFLGENLSVDPNAIIAGAVQPTVSPSGMFSPFSPTVGRQTQSSIDASMRADVSVTAVDPSGRGVTKGIVKGLEEIGVRIK